MNFFITNGTAEYMIKRYLEIGTDKLILLQGDDTHVLIEETTGKGHFANPRKYEIMHSSGTLQQDGIALLTHVHVDKEDRLEFEKQAYSLCQDALLLKGLMAFRILKPIKANTYCIYTQWHDEADVEMWHLMKQDLPQPNIAYNANIFISKNYTKKYLVPKLEDIYLSLELTLGIADDQDN